MERLLSKSPKKVIKKIQSLQVFVRIEKSEDLYIKQLTLMQPLKISKYVMVLRGWYNEHITENMTFWFITVQSDSWEGVGARSAQRRSFGKTSLLHLSTQCVVDSLTGRGTSARYPSISICC
jgi:hypothetical protein